MFQQESKAEAPKAEKKSKAVTKKEVVVPVEKKSKDKPTKVLFACHFLGRPPPFCRVVAPVVWLCVVCGGVSLVAWCALLFAHARSRMSANWPMLLPPACSHGDVVFVCVVC